MKILFYADTPTCTTGFGIVAKNIINQLLEQTEAQITVLGINERGDHSSIRYNPRLEIHPAFDGREAHGRLKLVKMMSTGEYDNVIIIHDLITVLQPIDHNGANVATAIDNLKPFYPNQKYHLYYPIDTQYPDEANLTEYGSLQVFDTLIPYTQFAKDQLKKAFPYTKINLTEPMYHGVNFEEFYPVSRQQKKVLRKEIFEVEDKRTIVSVIARNQWRKDIATSIETFKEFKKLQPDALLYLHSRPQDVGGDFRKYLAIWGLKEKQDYQIVNQLDVANGIPIEKLNQIYNASDILLSSAHGEGFGLPYLEAIATKTAIMTPATGVEQEILPLEYCHNYTGELYESSGQDGTPFKRKYVNNPKLVAEEMNNLLKSQYLPKIKEEAYQGALKKFSWEQNVKLLIEKLG